jgi:argininosuccinate lyase
MSRRSDETAKRYWRAIGRAIAANVAMLSHVELLDEEATVALYNAIDTVSGSEHAEAGLFELVTTFDDRLDRQTSEGVSGAARVGRGSMDISATAQRLVLRQELIEVSNRVDEVRAALIELASLHVTTLMPAYAAGQPAQPTTFAHFLGGLIGPVGRIASRLHGAFDEVNRSPLGAGSLASSGLPIDRELSAEHLGFDGLVVNTFDAVTAIDHLQSALAQVPLIATLIRRFAVEMDSWFRIESGSFAQPESLVGSVPDLPQLRISPSLSSLKSNARRLETEVASELELIGELPYAPPFDLADRPFDEAVNALHATAVLLSEFRRFITNGLVVNRPYLANRAGRDRTTGSDIADLLMVEEQIDPGSARRIGALVTARLIAEGIEVSGITTEMIDGVALMVIGREIKVEFESISRYLAPRRFVERRVATGAPAPVATRAYLDQERLRLAADQRWLESMKDRLERADVALQSSIDSAISRGSLG